MYGFYSSFLCIKKSNLKSNETTFCGSSTQHLHRLHSSLLSLNLCATFNDESKIHSIAFDVISIATRNQSWWILIYRHDHHPTDYHTPLHIESLNLDQIPPRNQIFFNYMSFHFFFFSMYNRQCGLAYTRVPTIFCTHNIRWCRQKNRKTKRKKKWFLNVCKRLRA